MERNKAPNTIIKMIASQTSIDVTHPTSTPNPTDDNPKKQPVSLTGEQGTLEEMEKLLCSPSGPLDPKSLHSLDPKSAYRKLVEDNTSFLWIQKQGTAEEPRGTKLSHSQYNRIHQTVIMFLNYRTGFYPLKYLGLLEETIPGQQKSKCWCWQDF